MKGLPAEVVENLGRLGITRPTAVQGQTFNALRKGMKTAVVCSPTGTGKSIAALMPIFANLASGTLRTPVQPSERRLLSLVLAPSEPLAAQLHMDIQLLWGASPQNALDDHFFNDARWARGGRVSVCLNADNARGLDLVQELIGEKAPAFLVTTPDAFLASLRRLQKQGSAGEAEALFQPKRTPEEVPAKHSGRQTPAHKDSKNAPVEGFGSPIKLADELAKCPQILELLSRVQYVMMDEADDSFAPPKRYSSKTSRERYGKRPPSAVTLMDTLKTVRGTNQFGLIAVSATLNTLTRQLMAERRWGRGPFNPIAAVQYTNSMQMPEGLRHRFHIYDDFTALTPNPFTDQLPVPELRPPPSSVTPLAIKDQAIMATLSECWRAAQGELRNALLIVPTGEIQPYAWGLARLSATLLPGKDRGLRLGDAAQQQGLTWLPHSDVISLDSPDAVEWAVRNRYIRRLEAVHLLRQQEQEQEAQALDTVSSDPGVPQLKSSEEDLEDEPELPEHLLTEELDSSAANAAPELPRQDLYVSDWKTARGLDLTEISHVFLAGVPSTPNQYVHLAGRTARGRFSHGTVVTLLHRRDKSELYELYRSVQSLQEPPGDNLTRTELRELRLKLRGRSAAGASGAGDGTFAPDAAASAAATAAAVEAGVDAEAQEEHDEGAGPKPADADRYVGDSVGVSPLHARPSRGVQRKAKMMELQERRRRRRVERDEQLLRAMKPEFMRVRELVREVAFRRMQSPAFWLAAPFLPGDRERLDQETIPSEKVEAALRRRQTQASRH